MNKVDLNKYKEFVEAVTSQQSNETEALCNQLQSLEILESLYANQKNWIRGKTVDELNDNLKKFIDKNCFQ